MPYTIRIHPKGEASEADRWNLSEFQKYIDSVQSRIGQLSAEVKISDSDTFMDLLCKFCKHYESNLEKLEDKDDQLANVTFALSPDWKPSERIVEGNLYLGNFGVVRNIVDTQDGKRQERGRDLDDSEERPLYFLIYMPSGNASEAYLLLEHSQRYGAKKPFKVVLQSWVQRYSANVIVEIDRVKTSDIFPKLREADRTVRFRLEKDGLPDQVHDEFDPVFDDDEMKQVIEFRPQDGGDMDVDVNELEAWFNDSERSFETIDGVSYNNVKITIEKNNSEETISITKGEAKMRRNIELGEVAEEGDIPLLTDISIQAHNYLDIVVGYDTGTRSLFR
ncbi:hypothetical protein [Halocatena marina]|uniref:hypothetical protein n=1 Tax=Halocatena marina TaxID=2934937 RepID=UPI00200F3D94|nr:hypothetical protein [Halocatena marina]